MKGWGLLVAAALLAALSGALYWSNHHKPSEATAKAPADAPPKILDLKQDNISRIDIRKKGTDDVALTRDASGNWQIVSPKSYRADQNAVSSLISSAASLNSDRLLDSNASNPAQYGLADPSFELDITEKNNSVHKLLIGDQAPAGNNSYAALAGDPRIFMLGSYSKTSLTKSLNDLRDKRLLVFDSDKLSRVELNTGKQAFEFGRDKDQWQIVKPKPFRADGSQVDDLIRQLTDAQIDLSGSAEGQKKSAAAFASGKPVASAALTDPAGTQRLEVRKNKDDYYAKSSTADGIYKVTSSLATGFDKKLDDFRNKKLFDFGYETPDKIEIRDGEKSYFFTHSGDDWWGPDGKKLDSMSADALLDKVRDLAANKFPDSGFTTPAVQIVVTPKGGKAAEKVLIAKSGNTYIAKREGEPALYGIEPVFVTGLQKAAADVKPAALPPAEKKK